MEGRTPTTPIPETEPVTPDDLTTVLPPSVDKVKLLAGESYAYFSPPPPFVTSPPENYDPNTDYFVLGIDEAGRGPVLGPMVYSAFYVPSDLHESLLAKKYRFDDSKVLTATNRARLMQHIITKGSPLHEVCGFAAKVLSARDISSGMMRPAASVGGVYNLNAQAMDATIEIIKGIVEERKMNVREVYIDTVGNPASYQKKLEAVFPSLRITVAKKADSLYPCVSAASVVAKVTRDVALEVCYEALEEDAGNAGWGSGYPSDSKCVNWLRSNMDPVFGWGNECRFSWGTAKEMLEAKAGERVDWPMEEGDSQLMDFLLSSGGASKEGDQELREWFGRKTAEVL
ncbi:ribonuclease H-like domain-containing protein [Aspergillus pseudoustus]|uniref:Ribonuclease n=1 Tax=Aspergillus pseudoustus TaxID=1810923 RepID=A0ABR4J9U8_9EURO